MRILDSHINATNSASQSDWIPTEVLTPLDRGTHGQPFEWLGVHERDGRWLISAAAHGALGVDVVMEDLQQVSMRRLGGGIFAAWVETQPKNYRLQIRWPQRVEVIADPYAFPAVLSHETLQAFKQGALRRPADVLGAHLMQLEGVDGVHFCVWAPNASRVSVVGGFNQWDGRRHVMRHHVHEGLWEIFIPGVKAGAVYKYEILDRHGKMLPLKADPYARRTELPPASASVVAAPLCISWHDAGWLATRASSPVATSPISIYEVHVGSWRRDAFGDSLDWDDLALQLIPYVQTHNFTHIELLPISEYPFGGSWGYQPTAIYAPTARMGSPDAFARFVDSCHVAGIGVIVDWVSAHFPSDEHGLRLFDGTALYEHSDPREGFHQDWHTLIYNYGRHEVKQFLIGSALEWIDRFHIDGLRVDAVASMLYRDYSRAEGEWIPNRYGGRENLEAIAFVRELNEAVAKEYPRVMMIAEESTAWPGVTREVHDGGLGFKFKWNLGWMHDCLDYVSRDPLYRRYHHNELTFGLVYHFSEHFILPLSHDEVVHGKGSLLARMPGDRWQKFANLRAFYGFMWAHPGKKLLFMGGEFAQFREWNHDRALDWHLLDQPGHEGVQCLVGDLNRLLIHEPALHHYDHEARGFEWLVGDDTHASVFAFMRRGNDGDAPLIAICNFTPNVHESYRIGVPEAGLWREVCNTDSEYYGGSNVGNGGDVHTHEVACRGYPFALDLRLPPLATLILRLEKSDS